MHNQQLEDLIGELRSEGVDVAQLQVLRDELEATEDPVGVVHKVTQEARELANRHWRAFIGELRESKRAWTLLRRHIDGDELTHKDRRDLDSQVKDLLRLAPAGMLTLAVEVIPIPGTSVMTPWLLSRLGLLPSRWRHAHLLEKLHEEAERLRTLRLEGQAAQLDSLATQISSDADAQEAMAHRAALHTHWDFDQDGVWDSDEVEAYESACTQVASLANQFGNERRWFLCYRQQVMGPVRLTEIREAELDQPLLVCLDNDPRWVCLDDLEYTLQPPQPAPAEISNSDGHP